MPPIESYDRMSCVRPVLGMPLGECLIRRGACRSGGRASGSGTLRRKACVASNSFRRGLIKNVVFIGTNLGLSGTVMLLTGVLALLALLLVAGLRAMAQRQELRLVPVRVRSRRRAVVRPDGEFLSSTPSRAPPFVSNRLSDDDLGEPPQRV